MTDEIRVGVYGRGKAGKWARSIVEGGGEVCVNCKGEAQVTVDFDVLADLTQLAVCVPCFPSVVGKILDDLEKAGRGRRFDTISYNGHGRA